MIKYIVSVAVASVLSVNAVAQENIYQISVNNVSKSVNIPARSSVGGTSSKEADKTAVTEPVVELARVDGVYVRTVDGTPAPLASCAAYIQAGMGQGQDGIYASTHAGGVNLRCDMTTDGGGWTVVTAQHEASPASWGSGDGAYDPTLTSLRSWVIDGIPAHTQTGFGHLGTGSVSPEFFMDFVYTTGNIPKTLITDQNGISYHIHRSASGNYGAHDPEMDFRTHAPEWFNTLTVDYLNETSNDALWTFSPHYTASSVARGYAYKGHKGTTSQTQPWLIFVR